MSNSHLAPWLAPLRLLTLQVLDHAEKFSWSVQGFGVLRLYVRKVGRLHIWDDELRYPDVSMIHNHSWDLRSTVICGGLKNYRFLEDDLLGRPFWKQRLLTGFDSKMVQSSPVLVKLDLQPIEHYGPGDVYRQAAHEIHRTEAENGTVTLMERREDSEGLADVYWPKGCTWGSAKPRPATTTEVARTVAKALRLLEQI